MPKANTNKNAKCFMVWPPWSGTADHVLFLPVPTCFVARPVLPGKRNRLHGVYLIPDDGANRDI